MAVAAGGALTAGAGPVFGAVEQPPGTSRPGASPPWASEVATDLAPETTPGAGAVRAPREPRIFTRAEWNAGSFRRPATVLPNNPDRIVIHHTASANTTDYSLQHAFALSRSIQRFHVQRRGWDDIGQHFTVSRGGHILEGRNKTLSVMRTRGQANGLAAPGEIRDRGHVVGAHTLHHNRHTVGIENEGTYASGQIPSPLWESLARLCAWLCTVYGLDPMRAIVGHRDLNTTDCPGDMLYGNLPTLRRNVVALLSV
jgi:hypothetical protein